MTDIPFAGSKVMLFVGDALLILERDRAPGLEWPGFLDFPGGAREGAESPVACALRETREETGLVLTEAGLRFAHLRDVSGRRSWFFSARLPAEAVGDVAFGGEGAGWRLMTPGAFCDHPAAIPHLRDILRATVRMPGGAHPPGQ